jgi:hypothetical protein
VEQEEQLHLVIVLAQLEVVAVIKVLITIHMVATEVLVV